MSEKIIFRIVMAVSMAVFLLVIVLNQKLIPPPAEIPEFIYKLPVLHAITNGTCSVLLIISYMSIRRKKVTLHQRLNITAFLLSTLFIASYVTYHYMAPETPFPTGNPNESTSGYPYGHPRHKRREILSNNIFWAP